MPTVNADHTQDIELSEILSRRTSYDSFKSATSWGDSYITAPSFLSSDPEGSSTAGIRNAFQALLQRGISPRLLHVTKVGQRIRTRISNSDMTSSQKALVRHLDQIEEEGESLKHEIAESAHYEREDGKPFDELDWCGRGMHVDFGDKDVLPLTHLAVAGHTYSAVVDVVRCRRVKLARKTVRLPRNRKVTPELLQEVLALHRLSHSHIVRLVGTYIHKQKFATLIYPAAEMNLEEYFEEMQSDPSDMPLQEQKTDHWFKKFAVKESTRSVLGEGSLCLASGLRYLHRWGIIHSDIKPANILLKDVSSSTGTREKFEMYFCDFGISRIIDPQDETQTEEDRGKTPRYASPEVMKGEPHGRASDIYSFGYVLAEMATVCSGLTINDFRNYIHFDAMDNVVMSSLAPETVTKIIKETSPVFRVYHKHYKPEQIESWFSRCADMRVPNSVVSQMLDEDATKRPRLTSVSADPKAVIFEDACIHENRGAPTFEIDPEILK